LKIWLQFLSFSFFISFITSSLHLFFCRPLVLKLKRFQSGIFLIGFVSSILFKMGPTFYSSCFCKLNSNFSFYRLLQFVITAYSLSLFTPNWSKYLPLFVFQNKNYLRPVQRVSKCLMHRSLPVLSMSCRSSFRYIS